MKIASKRTKSIRDFFDCLFLLFTKKYNNYFKNNITKKKSKQEIKSDLLFLIIILPIG